MFMTASVMVDETFFLRAQPVEAWVRVQIYFFINNLLFAWNILPLFFVEKTLLFINNQHNHIHCLKYYVISIKKYGNLYTSLAVTYKYEYKMKSVIVEKFKSKWDLYIFLLNIEVLKKK